jgi:CHAT domain-containing protein/Flp pilus assembly protein TadD
MIYSGKAVSAAPLLAGLPLPADRNLRTRLLMDRGYAAAHLSRFTDAENLLRQADSLASSGALRDEIALRLGSTYGMAGRIADAEVQFRTVLGHAEARGDLRLAAMASGNLGVLLNDSFHAEDAVFWLEHAKRLFENQNEPLQLVHVESNLGWCRLGLGDLSAALRQFEDAATRAHSMGELSVEVQALDGATETLLQMGDDAEATRRGRNALDHARRLGAKARVADLLEDLAKAAILRKDWDEAERSNQEASRIRQVLTHSSVSEINIEIQARIDAGRGNFSRAEAAFVSVLNDKPDDPSLVLESRAGLAHLYTSAGNLDAANRHYRAALDFIESQRSSLHSDQNKLTLFASMMNFYDDYVAFLIGHGQTGRALEIAESSRARLMAEKRQGTRRRCTVADFKRIAASAHATVLSYWLAPGHSYLWVVTPDRVVLRTLPGESEIRRLVASYRNYLEDLNDPLEDLGSAGPRLWNTLIEPEREFLPDGARVIIVPDGVLHSLNFETLPMNGAKPRYWIEAATISVAPSLPVLAAGNGPDGRDATASSLLLIGNPQSPGADFPPLAHAAEEMRVVAGYFAPGRRAVFEGARAQPAAYTASDPGRFEIIHFASHSSPNSEAPLESALILSPQPGGFELRARDVIEHPLHAELVTISACRGAGVRTYSGEGTVGLAWAFLEAGARNVIAGLWDVDDASTPALMARLYGELNHGLPPARALRDAKLEMIRSAGARRKPYYWGAFQLYSAVAH